MRGVLPRLWAWTTTFPITLCCARRWWGRWSIIRWFDSSVRWGMSWECLHCVWLWVWWDARMRTRRSSRSTILCFLWCCHCHSGKCGQVNTGLVLDLK
jgi:hypothetical protein